MSEPEREGGRVRPSLRAVAGFFLTLGTVAFGGPAAHIAMMEDQVVRRRGWLSREEFLDLLGAANLIPGPSSTELAIFIGLRMAGWAGLIVAGICFILPAFLIVSALAWAYVRYGTLPAVAGLLYGVKPVVIAVVLQALWGLGASALKTRWLAAVGGITLIAAAAGLTPLPTLLLGGGLAVLPRMRPSSDGAPAPALTLGSHLWPVTLPGGTSTVTLWPLFLVFVKVGAVLFGSGYVLLAFLHADLIQHLGWLTERQLLDAVAVGQVTPGPVFTTATFIGYVLGGAPGAVVATVAIFLPSFLFVAVSGPLLPRVRRSPVAGAMLDGITVASLALIAVVAWQLGQAALTDWLTVTLLAVSIVLLIRWRVNAAWLVVMGAAVGLLAATLRHT
jgi:chromate transporter